MRFKSLCAKAALAEKIIVTTASQSSDDTMGKAAYGTPSDAMAWSGHDAYNRALLGKVASKPDADTTMGKAAYGGSSSSADGIAAYHTSFRGD